MAKTTIGGVEYEVAPFGFRKMRLAAPHIDRVQAAFEPPVTNAAALDAAYDMLAIVAIGVDRPEVTADTLAEAASMADVIALQTTFAAILEEAGLKPAGEGAPAAAPGEA